MEWIIGEGDCIGGIREPVPCFFNAIHVVFTDSQTGQRREVAETGKGYKESPRPMWVNSPRRLSRGDVEGLVRRALEVLNDEHEQTWQINIAAEHSVTRSEGSPGFAREINDLDPVRLLTDSKAHNLFAQVLWRGPEGKIDLRLRENREGLEMELELRRLELEPDAE